MPSKRSFFLLGGITLLVLVALFNAFTVLSLDSKLDKKIDDIKEASRPGKIELSVITAPCEGCSDVSAMVDAIRGSKINITKETTFDPKTGDALIKKFGITRLPAIILEGEITKISASGFEEKEGALVFANSPAPYYDLSLKKIAGKVDAWRIEAPACDDCPNMQQIIDVFSDQGVFFNTNSQLKADSAEGKQLIAEHKIAKLPALLLSDDISAYPEVLTLMAQGGFKKSSDMHLYESTMPFYNVSSKKIRGLVDLTMISDSTCSECYDATLHRQILGQFGMTIGKETKVDSSSSEGKVLITKYAIKAVPAVILSGDVSLYTGFDQVWKTVGTIETDGAYVFRDNTKLGEGFPYIDLESGAVMNQAATP